MGLANEIKEDLYDIKNLIFLEYLRYNPIWYRKLSDSPEEYNNFKNEAKRFLKLTTYDKINSLKSQLNMVNLFTEYLKSEE